MTDSNTDRSRDLGRKQLSLVAPPLGAEIIQFTEDVVWSEYGEVPRIYRQKIGTLRHWLQANAEDASILSKVNAHSANARTFVLSVCENRPKPGLLAEETPPQPIEAVPTLAPDNEKWNPPTRWSGDEQWKVPEAPADSLPQPRISERRQSQEASPQATWSQPLPAVEPQQWQLPSPTQQPEEQPNWQQTPEQWTKDRPWQPDWRRESPEQQWQPPPPEQPQWQPPQQQWQPPPPEQPEWQQSEQPTQHWQAEWQQPEWQQTSEQPAQWTEQQQPVQPQVYAMEEDPEQPAWFDGEAAGQPSAPAPSTFILGDEDTSLPSARPVDETSVPPVRAQSPPAPLSQSMTVNFDHSQDSSQQNLQEVRDTFNQLLHGTTEGRIAAHADRVHRRTVDEALLAVKGSLGQLPEVSQDLSLVVGELVNEVRQREATFRSSQAEAQGLILKLQESASGIQDSVEELNEMMTSLRSDLDAAHRLLIGL